MSNSQSKTASREEEIAFLCLEKALGVEITLADAGGGNRMPDGRWQDPDNPAHWAIVEVTSPPDGRLMKQRAAAKRASRPISESGSVPTYIGQLAQPINEMLAEDWARDNFSKLLDQPAHERHLFLFGRSYRVENYFYRLSECRNNGLFENVDDLILPRGISDVWFRGRSRRLSSSSCGRIETKIARFQASSGWRRYVVELEELHLPAPNPHIATDQVSANLRHPKNRTKGTSD